MMPSVLTINLNTTIDSVDLIDEDQVRIAMAKPADSQALNEERAKLSSLATAIQAGQKQLEQMTQNLFAANQEAMLRLSIQIAAKILAWNIEQGNYQIETILKEALKPVAAGQPIMIRMNPDDHKVYQKQLSEGTVEPIKNAELVSDWAIEPAQCIIQTDKGVIEYLIDEHLKQVSKALLGNTDAAVPVVPLKPIETTEPGIIEDRSDE